MPIRELESTGKQRPFGEDSVEGELTCSILTCSILTPEAQLIPCGEQKQG